MDDNTQVPTRLILDAKSAKLMLTACKKTVDNILEYRKKSIQLFKEELCCHKMKNSDFDHLIFDEETQQLKITYCNGHSANSHIMGLFNSKVKYLFKFQLKDLYQLIDALELLSQLSDGDARMEVDSSIASVISLYDINKPAKKNVVDSIINKSIQDFFGNCPRNPIQVSNK